MSFSISPSLDPEKIFLVKLNDTCGRLDPSFYRPYFRRRRAEMDGSIHCVAALGTLRGRIFQGVGRNLVENAPTCLLKVKNITTDGEIDFSEVEPVAGVPKSKILLNGDIVSPFIGAAIKGYKFAKFSESERSCTVDNNTGVIRITDNRVSSDYLHAFCQTGLVRWQLDQLVGGGGVPFLGSEYAGKIRLPLPPAKIQEQVVKLLRDAKGAKAQAEEKARLFLQSIDDVLLDELCISRTLEATNTIENRIFRRSFAEITGGRLDPIANQEKRCRLEKAIHTSRYPIIILRKLVGFSKTIVKEIEDGTVYVGLENIDGESGEFISTADKESVSAAIQFQAGQILFPKLRPYLNKTHIASFSGICSTEFHVFTPQGASGAYITAFLRSRAIVGITSLLMTGNTLPRLQMSDIERLPIPIPPPDVQKKLCAEIASLHNKAIALRKQAYADIEKAKIEIEKLIIGKVSAK